MPNLAIIPARGGSKRIPKKNIKLFHNKPIIEYTITTLKNSNLFDEVMVSTDDLEIKNIAETLGAKVPFLRNEESANDFATLSQVILEVLNMYKQQGKQFEHVCCMLPTAALILPSKIKEGFDLLKNKNLNTVVPVIAFSYPIQRAFKAEKGILKLREPKHINTRSQDLETHYHDSGQFYWLNVEAFLNEKTIFSKKTGFIELREHEAQDVDTLEDWQMLNIKYNYKNLHNEKNL